MGIDPTRMLRADRDELPLLLEVVKHAQEWCELRDEALARRIVHELSMAMRRGRR